MYTVSMRIFTIFATTIFVRYTIKNSWVYSSEKFPFFLLISGCMYARNAGKLQQNYQNKFQNSIANLMVIRSSGFFLCTDSLIESTSDSD